MRIAAKHTLLLLALACGAGVYAQQTTAPPLPRLSVQPLVQYTGIVTGHVYCADTSAPARFARVQLYPVQTTDSNNMRGGFQPQVTTGLDGSYQIQNVPPGTYYVTASMPGYLSPLALVAPADLSSTDPAAQERVAKVLTTIHIDGSEGAHAELRLERGAAISGTVLYDDGSPAASIQVRVQPVPTTATTSGNIPPAYSTQQFFSTDDYGHYRISGLAPGDYNVIATANLFQGGGPGGNGFGGFNRGNSTLRIFAPKTFYAADAKVITLKTASEISGADIQIPVSAFHSVSGSAESSDGHALNAGNVSLVDDKDKTRSFRGSLDNSGQFHFLYVTAGSYTLTLTNGAITEQDTTTPNRGGRPRTVTLQSFGTGTQSVLMENGDLTGVTVQAPPLAPAASTATPSQ